jgi:hypothetical protein
LFLPKTWGLGIGWRFSLHLHPYPQLQPQRKLGSKFLAIFFLKYILYLMPIHESKECPNPIIITPKMGVGDLVKEMLPSATWLHLPSAFAFAEEKW